MRNGETRQDSMESAILRDIGDMDDGTGGGVPSEMLQGRTRQRGETGALRRLRQKSDNISSLEHDIEGMESFDNDVHVSNRAREQYR